MAKPLRQIVELVFVPNRKPRPQSKEYKDALSKAYKEQIAGKDKRGRGPAAKALVAVTDKERNEEVEELDKAKRPVYKRKGSLRAQVKSKTTLAKEKADRMRSMKASIRQAKETGEKPQIGTRGNQRSWKAARKSAVREEALNEVDTVSLSVPLFIRMLEYAKEDAKTDMDLHKATENILSLSNGKSLDMDSYEDIVNEDQLVEKKEYSNTKKSPGEGEREHFYVDMGRRAGYARDLKDMGIDARHEYSPYSNLSGISVSKKHSKKVSEFLWPRSRKKK